MVLPNPLKDREQGKFEESPNGNVALRTVNPYSVDSNTLTQANIDYSHSKIHEGEHFFVSSYTELNSGGTFHIAAITPNSDKWVHFNFNIQGNLSTRSELFEDATISGGTSVSPLNNNRNSNTSSDMSIQKEPSVTSSGTLISDSNWGLDTGGGATTVRVGGGKRSEAELIFKSGTTYLLKVESFSDGNKINYDAFWYEHTNL